jgi:hypothetical protein
MASFSQSLLLVAAAAAPARNSDEKMAVQQRDLSAQSAEFWSGISSLTATPEFRELESRASPVSLVVEAVKEGRAASRQPVANVAASTNDQAAAILLSAAKSKADPDVRAALSTITLMRTTSAQRAAALPTLPKQERAAASNFTANLSAGIQGLPGIYLDASPIQRPVTPKSYAPISGGSVGCPSK